MIRGQTGDAGMAAADRAGDRRNEETALRKALIFSRNRNPFMVGRIIRVIFASS
jgi:hypothetical protein